MLFGLSRVIPDSAKLRIRCEWKNSVFRLHTQLGRHTSLLRLYQLLGLNQNLVVTPDTDLVIEGAARTATTFTYYGVKVTQSVPLSIAYHTHLPAQVLRALELGTPVLITIRNPRDAVASAIVREPYMCTKAYLERYFWFYQTLKPYIREFLVVDFDQVVNEFPSVLQRLNARYGCDYAIPEDLSEFNYQVRASLTQHHRSFGGGMHQSYLPNADKKAAKEKVDFHSQQALLNNCEELYRLYLVAASH